MGAALRFTTKEPLSTDWNCVQDDRKLGDYNVLDESVMHLVERGDATQENISLPGTSSSLA